MKKKGFVALISVIIISAIILTISISLMLTNLNVSLSGLIIRQSQQAKELANTCSQFALWQLAQNFDNSNSQTFNFSEGICQFEILTINNDSRRINSWAEVSNMIRKESVELSLINNNLSIISWQELADF